MRPYLPDRARAHCRLLQLVCFFFFACLVFRPKEYYCWESSAEVSIAGSAFATCDYDAEAR